MRHCGNLGNIHHHSIVLSEIAQQRAGLTACFFFRLCRSVLLVSVQYSNNAQQNVHCRCMQHGDPSCLGIQRSITSPCPAAGWSARLPMLMLNMIQAADMMDVQRLTAVAALLLCPCSSLLRAGYQLTAALGFVSLIADFRAIDAR